MVVPGADEAAALHARLRRGAPRCRQPDVGHPEVDDLQPATPGAPLEAQDHLGLEPLEDEGEVVLDVGSEVEGGPNAGARHRHRLPGVGRPQCGAQDEPHEHEDRPAGMNSPLPHRDRALLDWDVCDRGEAREILAAIYPAPGPHASVRAAGPACEPRSASPPNRPGPPPAPRPPRPGLNARVRRVDSASRNGRKPARS